MITAESIKIRIQQIVETVKELKDKHTTEKNATVNYACIFSQSQEEYQELVVAAKKIGKIIEETPTGFLFYINPLPTVSGKLELVKIRIPDSTRPERGDADFTISNYLLFKKKYLSRQGFKLIKKREDFEMLEFIDPEFDVRVYFSHPPLDQQVEIKKKIKKLML